jgi:hypothetical protein
MAHGYAGSKYHGLERFAEYFSAAGFVVLVAVVSQVPIISGIEQGKRRTSPDMQPELEHFLTEDERSQLKGEPTRYMKVVADATGERAAYSAPEVIDFYLQPIPEGKWENKVTVRSARWSRMYEPGIFIQAISPTPLLMIVADDDRVTLTDVALSAYERALPPKQLKLIKGGHFEPYNNQFEEAAQAALNWFHSYLNNY